MRQEKLFGHPKDYSLYGFKQTYGPVSKYGLFSEGLSFDQIGVFSRDIRTITLLMEINFEQYSENATSVDIPAEDYSSFANLKE